VRFMFLVSRVVKQKMGNALDDCRRKNKVGGIEII
jgi:hypothetical protein